MSPSRIAAALLLAAACAPGSEAEAAAIAAENRAVARERFENHCASCHGIDGQGHGPVSASLNPPPRDWTDAEWQASVTDAELRIVIFEGGEGLGLSNGMPASDLEAGVVDGLVEIVRSFGK